MNDCTMFLCAHPLASPFAIAIVLVVVATAWVVWASAGTFRPWWPMGSAKWEFTSSWASNITVGAALVTAVMASAGTSFPNRDSYVWLNVVFLAISIAAPCVFNAGRKPTVDGSSIGLVGFAGMFLIAALLTIWATYGQLVVFVLVVNEVAAKATALESFARALYVVAAVIAIALLPYTVQTIYANIGRQRTKAFAVESENAPAPWSLL